MLNVPVNEKYRITSDAHNFILSQLQGKKKPRWREIGYYTTIDSLLWGFFNHKIRLSSCDNWQGLVECVKAAKRQIDTIRAAVLSGAGV